MLQRSTSSPMNTSQLKRTAHNSTPYDQPLDTQSNIQQLISRIQSTIFTTSEWMKHQLSQFQQHELINYKNDLLKTQEEFIKIRAERNEQAIKTSLLKEKAFVEEKFNTEIRKSMEMNARYEQMKALVKRMNDDEKEIMMEINYVQKKIQKETKEGQKLDEELKQMEIKSDKRQSKRVSKMDEERKLFTELVNKCENDNHRQKRADKEEESQKVNIMESYQKKVERRLKYEISNLKDYIENIPLELNFVQNVLYNSIKNKFQEAKLKVQEQLTEQLREDMEDKQEDEQKQLKEEVNQQQNTKEDEANKENHKKQEETQKNNQKTCVIKKKLIKLPSITHANILQVKDYKKNSKNAKHNKENPLQSKPLNSSSIQPYKPSQTKSKIVQKQKQAKENQQIPNIEQLPKSFALLQEILSDPQVKEYLYKIMFEGQLEE